MNRTETGTSIGGKFKAAARALTAGRTGRALGLAAAVTLTALTSACSSFTICADQLQQCRIDLGIRGDIPIVSKKLAATHLGITHYRKDGSSVTEIPYDSYRPKYYDVLGIPRIYDYWYLPYENRQYVNYHYKATCADDTTPALFTQNGYRGLTCVKNDGSAYELPTITVPGSFPERGVIRVRKPCEFGSVEVVDKDALDGGNLDFSYNHGGRCFFLKPPAETLAELRNRASSAPAPR